MMMVMMMMMMMMMMMSCSSSTGSGSKYMGYIMNNLVAFLVLFFISGSCLFSSCSSW